jgi:hypothetical protein
MNILTNSRLQSYRRCAREEFLRYQMGLTPAVEGEPLRFGSGMHHGLEAWWNGAGLDASLAALGLSDAYERIRAEELLRGYDARWGDEAFEVIAVEHEFRLPLINPETGAPSRTWQLGGKKDVLVRDAEGRAWVMEHKTSSDDIGPGSMYMERLRLDGQVSMYFRAAREMGYEPAGVIYDVIGKVGLRPLKATPVELRKYTKPTKADPISRLYANQRESDETPEEYRARVREHIIANVDDYQRARVMRLESEIVEFERELWQQASSMRDAMRLGVSPRNPDACKRFNSMCSYFDICTGVETPDSDRWKRLEWPHSELTKPKEEAEDETSNCNETA